MFYEVNRNTLELNGKLDFLNRVETIKQKQIEIRIEENI